MFFTLFLTLGLAYAASDDVNTFEKTYKRDNTFCQHGGKRFEFIIRASLRNPDPGEQGFGEFLFIREEDNVKLLTLNESRADSLKFMRGKNSVCSKVVGFPVNDKSIGIILLKENKPFKEKLVIQFIDLSTMSPTEFIETDYSTDEIEISSNGFVFNSLEDRTDTLSGKVTIEEKPYTYQDRGFTRWMSYSKDGFETLSKLTYEKFPLKEHFKDEKDFLEATNWDSKNKSFLNKHLFVAVNHKIKQRCIYFASDKSKLNGSEKWRCQAM